MAHDNKLSNQFTRQGSIVKPMLAGGAVALILILIFLLPNGEPKPEWGKFWMLRPLIIVPLAGAVGGAIYHIINRMSPQRGWKRVLAVVVSVIIYVVVLWVGTVLGLDGTMWD